MTEPAPEDDRADLAPGGVVAVVVTYRRPDQLLRCLVSLEAQTVPVDWTVVVNNGPLEDADVVAGLGRLTLVTPGENLGPAGGFAVGIDAASGRGARWLWLFNDDDAPEPRALETLLAAAAGLDDAALVGSWLLDGTGHVRPNGARWRGRAVPLKLEEADPPAPCPCDVITFTGVLLAAAAARNVGLPRADYFMMLEEYEYCLRAAHLGYRAYVVPVPLIRVGALGSSSGRSPPWRFYYQARNHLAMAIGHRSAQELLWWGVRQVKLLLVGVVTTGPLSTRVRMQLRGCVDGLRRRRGRTVEPW